MAENFDAERPLRQRPVERALPDWLWGDPLRHTRASDGNRVVIQRAAHLAAIVAVKRFAQLLSDEIAEREEALSVPNLGILLPGGLSRLPDRDQLEAALNSATVEGLRQARQLLSTALRPEVLRFWISLGSLNQSKARRRGKFSARDDYSNRMTIRVPHK